METPEDRAIEPSARPTRDILAPIRASLAACVLLAAAEPAWAGAPIPRCVELYAIAPSGSTLPANVPAIPLAAPWGHAVTRMPAIALLDAARREVPVQIEHVVDNDTLGIALIFVRPASPLVPGPHRLRYEDLCAGVEREIPVDIGPPSPLPDVIGQVGEPTFALDGPYQCPNFPSIVATMPVALSPEMKAYAAVAVRRTNPSHPGTLFTDPVASPLQVAKYCPVSSAGAVETRAVRAEVRILGSTHRPAPLELHTTLPCPSADVIERHCLRPDAGAADAAAASPRPGGGCAIAGRGAPVPLLCWLAVALWAARRRRSRYPAKLRS